TSEDGTPIGYRRFGHGPGLVLVHGGMQATHSFTKLATALSDAFTVYVPDRRGRGRSGPFREDHGIRCEVEDLRAVLGATGARDLFALSAGAVFSLQAALELPDIRRLALYEPPLSFADSPSTTWTPRYERELADGKLASAFVTIVKGTGDSAALRLVPRFVPAPLLGLALNAQAKRLENGDVTLRELVPAMRYDARAVLEASEDFGRFGRLRCEVLLLGGKRSARYLKVALDRLAAVLPRARRVELAGVGHLAADDNGQPERVAAELRRFFARRDGNRLD